ncbi:putative cysteine desulfurase NifS [Selenomonas sp. FOBRC9]|uniref:cysteine desulfurase family protein n=1 Tax=Selenomonas sp. FOBRC9 TaxID=936573 RepID=UPI00027A5A2C|nr:cysteine desulfurase family protein [Selenomonas sp. FOBRC9]EJP31729.1 putative cysteine desulfurase NifS [Selenomonas sp. FOBRC9]
MSERFVYLDHAATTPIDPRVYEAMQPYLSGVYGNPSSLHTFGQLARRGIDRAREKTAALIGALPEEIFFTSGGTESDNWAIRGLAEAGRTAGKGAHIVTSSIEHHAVLESCRAMEHRGFSVTYLPVDTAGRIDPADVSAALRQDTVLVSIMTANNEVGSIQPLAEIGTLLRGRGIPFHTDAVQAVGHIPLDVNVLGVDALSLSAHKFYGAKGVGALYVRRGTAIAPLFYGGAQERDMRAGTENMAGIVACGKAAEIACAEQTAEEERLRAYTELLRERIGRIRSTSFHGDRDNRLAGVLNFGIAGIAQDTLLIRLDLAGFAVSAGSACSAGAAQVSHVLRAMGCSEDVARTCIRVSLGRHTTREDVLSFAETLAAIAEELQ